MATPTAVTHDHIILLLDKEAFENPPSWLTSNFTIIEGGTHTGGSSRNKLIIFKDGTYLELFTWIAPPVEFLAWSNKLPGLIDFALTTLSPITAQQNHTTIQQNLSQLPKSPNFGITYDPPIPGSRKRADGKEVQWLGSRPNFEGTSITQEKLYFLNGRNDVPFFCHDVTPRTVRVPFDDEALTNHPCGAVGIDSVEVCVPRHMVDEYVALYGAVLDCREPEWRTDGRKGWEGVWFPIRVPESQGGRQAYVVVYHKSEEKSTEDESDFFTERGIGIRSVTFRTGGSGDGSDARPLASDGIGSTVLLCS